MKVDTLTFYYNDGETAVFDYSAKDDQWKLYWKDEGETAETLVKVVTPLLSKIVEMFNELPQSSWEREGEYDAEALLEYLYDDFDLQPLDGEKLMVAGLSSFAYWSED